MTLHALSVGKPYGPGRRSWPEAADYNYRGDAQSPGSAQHELRIFLAGPTPREVEVIRSGPVEFGMFAEPQGLVLVTWFGRSTSFDTPYQWHRVGLADRVPPPPVEETSPELRALVAIILVDASTGIVRALRAVTFSPEFTRAIHCAIAEQAAAPFDAPAHDRWADRLLRFTTDQLWDRTTVRCRGGE
jgi:hypothetical protein